MGKYNLLLLLCFVSASCLLAFGVLLRFLNTETRHKIRLTSTKQTSDTVSKKFAIIIRKIPNKAIIMTNVARPNICFRILFSLAKNISLIATKDMTRIPSEDGIPIKGDATDTEFNRIAAEKTSKRSSLINARLLGLFNLVLIELITSTHPPNLTPLPLPLP
jgi:hypothetical protein